MADSDGTPPSAPLQPANRPSLQQSARLVPAVVRRELKKRSGTTPFLIWISFLISFTVSRLYVILVKSVNTGDKTQVAFSIGRNIVIGGYHIHHIAIGVVLLAAAGWIALHYRGRQIARTSALMYGVGLGFIVDEVGFIIGNIRPYRGDVETFYIAVAIGALLMSAVYFPSFWRGVREDTRQIGRLVRRLPSINRPRSAVARGQLDQEMDAALGPVVRHDPDPDPAIAPLPVATSPTAAAAAATTPSAHGTAPSATASVAAPAGIAAHAAASPTTAPPVAAETATTPPAGIMAIPPLDRDALFQRLLARIVDVMILIIFAALLLGLAKLILSLPRVFLGLSVATMMQPILTGILTLLIGVELFRAMTEFVRSSRIMLPFLVDAGILLGLRELTVELASRTPDPVLVAAIGGTLVALGGLRVFLVRTMLPGRGRLDGSNGPPAP